MQNVLIFVLQSAVYVLLFFHKASLSVETAAASQNYHHPSLLVKDFTHSSIEVFIVAENTIVTQVCGLEAPTALLSAYYAFNMHYPKGSTCVCTLLEILLCGLKPAKVPQIISNNLIGLNNN